MLASVVFDKNEILRYDFIRPWVSKPLYGTRILISRTDRHGKIYLQLLPTNVSYNVFF